MIEPVIIHNRPIGPGHPPLVVAEACINHEGDIRIAEKMVYMAHALGADAVKFQIHVLENEMLRDTPLSDNFDEPLWNVLDRTNLTIEEHMRLKSLCERLGILYMCTPFSRDGADILEEIGVSCYKTGSGELTNLPLIEHIARKGKPMIVSTGMCHFEEVQETVGMIQDIGTPLILTHCISAYPAPYDIVNIQMIPRYSASFRIPVGLSDHSKGIYTALGAVALGASLLEKHFTLDKTQKGPDHASSIEPFELAELVKGAEAVFQSLGEEKRIFSQEKQIVAWARHSVVSEVDIPKGTRISHDMVWVKRPGPTVDVIPAGDLSKVIGKAAAIDIKKDTQIRWSDLIS